MTTTINHTNLEYLKLMTGGDTEMEKTMLEMLMIELPDEFEKMKALHSAGDWDQLTKVSHKMKSTLAFIGNDIMTNANARIEKLTKAKEGLELVPELMATFENSLPDVMQELNLIVASY